MRYIRDKEKREVDLVIVRDDKVEELVEVKFGDADFSQHLAYYAERLNPQRAVQVVATLKRPVSRGRLTMQGPLEYLAQI